MRRALVLLLLALAAPAFAASGKPTVVVAKPKPAPVQTPVAAPTFALPAPIPLAVGRPGGDTLQCKSTCAKTLYFCNATLDDEACGARWAQCNASCSAAYAPPRFGR